MLFRSQEVEAWYGTRDTRGEHLFAAYLDLGSIVFGEAKVVEKFVGAGTVEAEDAPRHVLQREVFDLDAGEGSVAAQDLARRLTTFGLGIHEYVFAALEDAQVGLHPALRVQERRVDAEVGLLW